jgi:hypothetical protein
MNRSMKIKADDDFLMFLKIVLIVKITKVIPEVGDLQSTPISNTRKSFSVEV